MNTDNNIRLSAFRVDAGKAFESMKDQLDKLDEQITSLSHGRTRGGMTGITILPFLWIAVYLIVYLIFRESTGMLGVAALIAVLLLCAVMIIDNAMAGKHYSMIFAYQAQSERLRKQAEDGRQSMERNSKLFSDARRAGWNLELPAADSIPDSIRSITNGLASIRSLESGKINVLKNILYYASIVGVTAAGSYALYPVAGNIIRGLFSDHSFEPGTIRTLCIVGTLISCVGAALLGALIWGIECRVSNKIMLFLPAGPVLFLALMGIGALLVFLVIGLVKIVIALATLAIGAIVVCGCLSGG